MKRRPFFLLEVLIAIILVGGFAYLTLQGAFGVISKQRKLIKGFEAVRNEDLIRMDIIQNHWTHLEAFMKKEKLIENGYELSCMEGKKDKYYLMKMKKDDKEYQYFITKEARS